MFWAWASLNPYMIAAIRAIGQMGKIAGAAIRAIFEQLQPTKATKIGNRTQNLNFGICKWFVPLFHNKIFATGRAHMIVKRFFSGFGLHFLSSFGCGNA